MKLAGGGRSRFFAGTLAMRTALPLASIWRISRGLHALSHRSGLGSLLRLEQQRPRPEREWIRPGDQNAPQYCYRKNSKHPIRSSAASLPTKVVLPRTKRRSRPARILAHLPPTFRPAALPETFQELLATARGQTSSQRAPC